MTVRLVALMSVVLLLCLGAFGLLMSFYQDRVMAEVARTVSEVGRATLRTLEFQGEEPPHLLGAVPGHRLAGAVEDDDPAGRIEDRDQGVDGLEDGLVEAPSARVDGPVTGDG